MIQFMVTLMCGGSPFKSVLGETDAFFSFVCFMQLFCQQFMYRVVLHTYSSIC